MTKDITLDLKNLPNDGTFTLLTGSALPQQPKNTVALSGTIGSVLDFATKRAADLAAVKNKVHTIFNRKKLQIKLVALEDEAVRYEVTGTLELVGEVLNLGINDRKGYRPKDLASVLKLKRWLFRSVQEQAEFVGKLVKVETKVNQEFKDSDDFRGNKAHQKTQDITTSIPLSFVLVAPIAEGEPKSEFIIDIELDVVNGTEVLLYLVSAPLEEAKQAYIEAKFAEAKTLFDNAGFVVIEQ